MAKSVQFETHYRPQGQQLKHQISLHFVGTTSRTLTERPQKRSHVEDRCNELYRIVCMSQ